MVLKRIILITLLMWPFLLYASDEEALCIHTKEGYQTFFFFQNKPKVVIKNNILEITTSDETVKYPLDESTLKSRTFRLFKVDSGII